MATATFTDLFIKKLSPKPTQFDVWDEKETGLGIRISPAGTRTFFYWYRVGTRGRRLTLGRYPTLSLSDARERAREARRAVADGYDPATTRKQARETATDRLFSSVLERFERDYPARQTRSWTETKRTIRREFLAAWKNHRLNDIIRQDVSRAIQAIHDRGTPSAAHHAFVSLRTMLNWAVKEGIVATSACVGIKLPSKPVSRDRVLSRPELAAIWRAAGEMGYPFGHIVRLLILTAQRRDEVAGMRWDELDLDGATWTIPAGRTKSSRTHTVPLSTEALGVIAEIPRLHARLVFPAVGKDNPVSGFSKWKSALDRLLEDKVGPWRLHDLRRTTASGLAELGVAPHVIEQVLNHKTGKLSGVAGIYNRYGYLPDMRDALQRWASQHFAGSGSNPPSE